jgi:hypothetical protein
MRGVPTNTRVGCGYPAGMKAGAARRDVWMRRVRPDPRARRLGYRAGLSAWTGSGWSEPLTPPGYPVPSEEALPVEALAHAR